MNLTQPLIKELESHTLARFQDCDPFGHLNNARYIDYFLNARQDQLAAYYDFHIFVHGKETNENWVVTRTHIAYLYPAAVMEEICIRTKLILMSDSTLVVEGIMYDKTKKRAKSIAWMEFTYINLTSGRTAKHPADFLEQFGQVVMTGIYEPDGFNQRVEVLRRESRQHSTALANLQE